MMILGIDPGLCITGWAILHEGAVYKYGLIKTTPKEELYGRIQFIYSEIKVIIAEHKIVSIGIEAGYCGIDGVTALKLGMVRGAVIAAGTGLHIATYAPSTVKLQIAGNGHANKTDMLDAIHKRFPTMQFSGVGKHDIADAIGVGLCMQTQLEESIA
jgi:crossover junction endodeoxyribonuclease RuvC